MKTYKELVAELPIQRGDRVCIKAGAEIRTTHPKGPRTSARAYYVTVHDVSPGYDCPGYAIRKPEIVWVGSGSYWFYTDMENVEKV